MKFELTKALTLLQVKQVIREWRRTKYTNVKHTILGSREQTCINRELDPLQSKTAQCRELLSEAGVCCTLKALM